MRVQRVGRGGGKRGRWRPSSGGSVTPVQGIGYAFPVFQLTRTCYETL